MSAYSDASKAVFEVFRHTTPLVEGISIDEAFLDVGGRWRVSGTPVEIATQLRRDVLERVGLAITVGGLDVEVLTEAGKSLSYRFEYWQASLDLIADHPWAGCGPGAAFRRGAGCPDPAPYPLPGCQRNSGDHLL